MIVYCDTSLLVASLVQEPRTRDVQTWLDAQPEGGLCISDWSVTEFSSALSIKVRARELSPESRAKALAGWAAMRNENLLTFAVLPAHFAAAAVYVERADLRLRAPDALHLAIAASNGCSIATLGGVQARAALELGIPVETV